MSKIKTAPSFPKTITVKGKKGEVDFKIKKFSKKAIGEALTMLSPRPNHEVDIILAGEILLNDAFISGSDLVKTSDKYITGGALACKEIMLEIVKEFTIAKIEDLTVEEKKDLPENCDYIIIVEDKKCFKKMRL